MADNSDDIVLQISSDTAPVKRQLRQLGQDITAATNQWQKSFEKGGAAIDKAFMPSSAVQKRINEFVGITEKAGRQWSGVLAEQGKEMDRLRAKYNPIFAVVTKYKASVADIQTAHKVGALSATEMAAALDRERTAALADIAAIKGRNTALADTPVRRGAGNFNTANIAAQFQDIGVTAAMGMSPMQIALQQGTQLSMVFEQMKASGQSVGAGLAAAFTSIISPVSLVTIGVIGAGAAAAQFFATFFEGAGDTEEALKAQADLIQAVADKWGDALPALKAYADEQKRLADQADVGTATAALVQDIWGPAKTAIEDTRVSLADLVVTLSQAGAESSSIVALQQAFGELRTKAADGTGEVTDLQRVSDALTKLYEETSIKAVSSLAAEFANLADQISKASVAATAAKAQAALKDMQGALGPLGTIGPVYSAGGKLINEDELQTVRANAKKSQYQIELERAAKKSRGGGARAPRRTANDRFFEDIEAIRQRTIALAEEAKMVGMGYEAQTKRKIAFDLEQKALKDVREEARKKGDQDWQNAQLTPEQVAKINEVSEAYAAQAENLRLVREAQAEYEDWMNLGRDATRGFIQDLIEGKSAGEAFANVLGKIGDKLLDMAMNDLWGGGSGGGALGSLFSLLGGGAAADPWAGLRLASGGTVRGPGGPTGDKIPAMLSDGEHVTRSTMAKKYAPLLDAINNDNVAALWKKNLDVIGMRLPKFAAGGWASLVPSGEAKAEIFFERAA